jgi:hypothetical protein
MTKCETWLACLDVLLVELHDHIKPAAAWSCTTNWQGTLSCRGHTARRCGLIFGQGIFSEFLILVTELSFRSQDRPTALRGVVNAGYHARDGGSIRRRQ